MFGFGDDYMAPGGSGASTATKPLFDALLARRLMQAKAAQSAAAGGGASVTRDLTIPSYEENKALYYVVGGVALLGLVGAVLYFRKK